MSSSEPAWVGLTPILLEIPEDLGPLKQALTTHLEATREELFRDLGVRFPPIVVRDNLELADGAYRVFLNEIRWPGAW